VKKRYWFNM